MVSKVNYRPEYLVSNNGSITIQYLSSGYTNIQTVGGGGVPASPVNSVQFNNAGAFGGSANFAYNTGTNTVSFGNITGSATSMTIQPLAPTSGGGGTFNILTRNGVGVNTSGGDLNLTLGSGNGTGVGGTFSLVTGFSSNANGATLDVNGAIPGLGGSFFAGSGYTFVGAGGDFTFFLGGGATDDGNMYFQSASSNYFIWCKTASPGGADQIGFFNATPVTKPAPTASGTGNVLSSVVTALNSLGLVSSAALTNADSTQTVGVCWSLVGTTIVGDYTALFKSPFAFTINETSMICVSGSATATVKINTTNVTGGTAIGGGSQSVGTTTTTVSRTSANTVNAGNSIVVTFTAGAVNPSVTIKGTRT